MLQWTSADSQKTEQIDVCTEIRSWLTYAGVWTRGEWKQGRVMLSGGLRTRCISPSLLPPAHLSLSVRITGACGIKNSLIKIADTEPKNSYVFGEFVHKFIS